MSGRRRCQVLVHDQGAAACARRCTLHPPEWGEGSAGHAASVAAAAALQGPCKGSKWAQVGGCEEGGSIRRGQGELQQVGAASGTPLTRPSHPAPAVAAATHPRPAPRRPLSGYSGRWWRWPGAATQAPLDYGRDVYMFRWAGGEVRAGFEPLGLGPGACKAGGEVRLTACRATGHDSSDPQRGLPVRGSPGPGD